MSPITTHVLDTAKGAPAREIPVSLELQAPDKSWKQLAHGVTNEDGRIRNLLDEGSTLQPGVYRMTFYTEKYLAQTGGGFYPYVQVAFDIKDPRQHFHIPLLLSPFGYSTYRGS
jgi:5-hydroxyisourate hydrolase